MVFACIIAKKNEKSGEFGWKKTPHRDAKTPRKTKGERLTFSAGQAIMSL